MLMWTFFFIAIVRRLRKGPSFQSIDYMLMVWIFLSLVPLIVLSQVQNYGFRYVVPGVLIACVATVRWWYFQEKLTLEQKRFII